MPAGHFGPGHPPALLSLFSLSRENRLTDFSHARKPHPACAPTTVPPVERRKSARLAPCTVEEAFPRLAGKRTLWAVFTRGACDLLARVNIIMSPGHARQPSPRRKMRAAIHGRVIPWARAEEESRIISESRGDKLQRTGAAAIRSSSAPAEETNSV